MPDQKGGKGQKTTTQSGDYKSVDPAPITHQKSGASGLTVTVTPTSQTGAGNTLTVTATDADTGKVLGSPLVVQGAVTGVLKLVLPDQVHRVTITPVGTGTRTTLTYSIDVRWDDLNYSNGVVFDGTAYVNSDKHNA